MPSFAAPLTHSLDRLHQRPESSSRRESLLGGGLLHVGSSNSHYHASNSSGHGSIGGSSTHSIVGGGSTGGSGHGGRIADPSPSSRQRSRSPSKISHKGQIKLHVAETVVLVHPPESKLEVLGEGIVNQVQQPQEDKVLNGQIEVIMDKPRLAKAIRVELVVTCRVQIPGENHWHDQEIFTRMVEIVGGDGDARTPDESLGGGATSSATTGGGIMLEKGSQRFEFSIIVPATLATYDRHPLGRILPMLRATVEGFPQPASHSHHHASFNNLFSGMGIGKPRGDSRSRNRSRPSSRPSSRPGSRAPSPNRIPRNGSSTNLPRNPSTGHLPVRQGSTTSYFRQPALDLGLPSSDHPTWMERHIGGPSTPSSPMASPGLEFEHGDVAFPLPTQGEIKPLKGSLLAEKVLVVAANPSSKDGEGLTSLSMQKNGRLAGVGDWKLSLTSDAFSVGSYVTQRIVFLSPSPFATIFAARLLLNQTYSVTDPSRFDPNFTPAQLNQLEWHTCPKRSFLVSMDGQIPHVKRPGPDTIALWKGSLVGTGRARTIKEADIPFEPDYKLKTGRKRLPDDNKARPSTIEGTITPIRVHHELVLQVFFSVDGEDLQGNPLEGEDSSGVMRMLVLTMPTVLPSCTCTFERVTLPEYCEVQQPFSFEKPGACACGNSMEDFARREATRSQEEEDDDINQLDVDEMSLDGRQRGRRADRRKAEYDGSHTPTREDDRR